MVRIYIKNVYKRYINRHGRERLRWEIYAIIIIQTKGIYILVVKVLGSLSWWIMPKYNLKGCPAAETSFHFISFTGKDLCAQSIQTALSLLAITILMS
jgi:hypothetical protein